MITVAVSAVQGGFIEHENMCRRLGAECVELRQSSDLDRHFDALILPGGESTVQGKLLKELGMFGPLKEMIENGLPVLATCAGLILLAESSANDTRKWFATMPVTVVRNAYGRQLGSFHTSAEFRGIGNVPMTFIRAPYIENVLGETEILAETGGHIVAARWRNQTALSFHPELDGDLRIHRQFLESV